MSEDITKRPFIYYSKSLYTCILLLRLESAIEIIRGYDRLTGSGEVHKILGSQKLPRQKECLPGLRWPALGNWGV